MSKKHAQHGGSWKVAYADFTTAMMALFLCLWLTSQDQKIKDAVERAFRNPFSAVTKESVGIIPNSKDDASSSYKQEGRFSSVSAVEMETMRRLSEDLAKLLKQRDEDQSSVQIELTPDGLLVNIFDRSQKPIFNSGTDVFTDYGAWVFSTLAWEIARFTTFHIELEGHTETSRQTGREAHSQWELSTERANAARRLLHAHGLRPQQVVEVRGYADQKLLDEGNPGSARNRRISLVVRFSGE